MPQQITETITLSEAAAAQAAQSGRMLVEFITPGWGSSGYYSPQVIEAAATDRVIPAGTHMYADHPTEAEDIERPIRSIRDLVAVTTEDARLSEDGTLVGEVEVVESWRPFMQTVHSAIGVSIRGSATDIVPGQAEGRSGGIIEGLVPPVMSVDFVTRAGRGGRVLSLLESARREHVAATRAIGHGVAEATVNDIRDALGNTLRDAYASGNTYVWVRDFDETTVWFEVENDGDGNGIYAQAYSDDGATLTGDRTEVRVVTTYQPIGEHADQTSRSTRPGSTTHQPSEEDIMPNIEESELARLREADGRVATLTTERDQAVTERDTAQSERDDARRQLAERDRRDAAIAIIGEADTEFSPLEQRGLLAALPLTEAGELDAEAFRTAVTEAAAESASRAGVGTVRGFGSKGGTQVEVSEDDLDAIGDRTFGVVKGA